MRRALAFVLMIGCGNTMSNGAAPLSQDGRKSDADGAVAAVVPTVVVMPEGQAQSKVRVSLARTDVERQHGLMYVQNLAPDDGMLFLFDEDAVQSFWMKNTLIPLDLIFIRSDMTVAGVVANAQPLTLTPRTVGIPSRYVLEVNGGWAARHGVAADSTKVRFDNLP
jgi:uncharacterized protein